MKKIIELSKLEGNRGQIAGVPVNPRKITPRNFDKLKNSIKRDPELLKYRGLLVAPHGDKFVVIGGNQRLEALRALGFTETTCEIMDDLEQIPEEDRAEVLRHRILADNAGFGEDDDELIEEFFSDIKGDYETLSDDDLDQEPEDEEEILEVKTPELEEDPKSELGKIYQLGEHRLMCGDSTSESDVKKLMGGVLAHMIHTDPPYGVSYNSEAQGSIQNDEIVGSELYEFLYKALNNAYANSTEKCACYVWHAHATEQEFYKAVENAGFIIKQQIIWNKESLTLGRATFHWKHEPCYLAFKNGLRPPEASERKSTTVWDSPEILKTLSKKELLAEIEKWQEDSTVWDLKRDPRNEYIHPTQKPIAIPAKAIKKHTQRGDTVLDLFAGSGSTLLACEQLGRICHTMELDPKFVDRIRKRYYYYLTGTYDGWEEATPEIQD